MSMSSMSMRGMRDKLYGNGTAKEKRKPCPSEKAVDMIDRAILRELVGNTEEVCEDVTACEEVSTAVESPCCEVPMPQTESRIRRKEVPLRLRKSIYDEPCDDSGDARATLEGWDIHGIRLAGRIYGDRRGQYPDGEMIYTGTVKTSVSKLKEGALIRTRNNYYLLGKQHVPNDE